MRFRWLTGVILGGITGCLPLTVSGAPEFCAVVVLPICLGYLVNRCWTDSLVRLTVAILLPLIGSLVRLLSSSLHDGSNWFASLFRYIDAVGVSDPYSRHILLKLVFPVLVTVFTVAMLMISQSRGHAKDAR